MDTDSLMTRQSICVNELIDEKKLGCWKLEKLIKKIQIYGSKFYRLFEQNWDKEEPDKPPEGHCKGIKRNILTDENFWDEIHKNKFI